MVLLQTWQTVRSGLSCGIALATAACAGGQTGSGFQPLGPSSDGIARLSAGPHLYVADTGKILRFSLVNGLPNQSPDETLVSVPRVQFLGVDGKGAIYAEVPDGYRSLVRKFDAGGTLEGTATLDQPATAFAVDRDGYMYLSPNRYGNAAYVYAPSVFTESLGQPIATLQANRGKGGSDFVYLGVGERGRLYAAAYNVMNVFDHPRKTTDEQSGSFNAPAPHWQGAFDGAVAFDETNHLYANLEYLNYCAGPRHHPCREHWRETDFDAPLHPLQTNHRNRIVYGTGCKTSRTSGYSTGRVTGMAVYGGYIDAACTGDTSGVWIFYADRFAHQNPVETLSGLKAPTDAKIGP